MLSHTLETKNIGHTYRKEVFILGRGDSKNGLEILVDSQVNVSSQCNVLDQKVHEILECMNKEISSRSWEVILTLHKALRQLFLDQYVQDKYPQFKKDNDKLESVQRKIRTMI